MRADIDLDHVAIAVEAWTDAWPRYAGELAGRWVSGGANPEAGFGAGQLGWANGIRLEVLEPTGPVAAEPANFLRRFLDANGPGPHHLTYKVADLEATLDRVRAGGYEPVGTDLTSRAPQWRETFLHPRQASGIVIQLAQSGGDWQAPPPPGLASPLRDRPATLVRVAHAVADLDRALQLFCGLLGGEELDRQTTGDPQWVDLGWPGPGRVRLLAPAGEGSPLWSWLGRRPGRLHHLAFTCAHPDQLAGSRPLGEGPVVAVEPEDNLGVRLIVAPPGTEPLAPPPPRR
ncbi:MAG TPA: VOC family protein [Acidimicrobiales bacterium]|nr:VOC family protein [Acidimicrobiales bacterium]